MSTYLIGDVHGCYNELIALLKQIKFSADQDILWLVGDLVARGPNSLEVLRYVKSLGNSVRLVLGNHDLHLLATYSGVNFNKTKNYFTQLLKSPDVDELLNWLRCQPLLQIDEDKKLIMVHAGIILQWNLQTVKNYAHDVEAVLSSDLYPLFLNIMYNNHVLINDSLMLNNLIRLRFIANVFTRMRYCLPNGKLSIHYKNIPEDTSSVFMKPWFSIPGPIIEKEKYNIVFGHWAALEGKGTPKGIYALDTGCCWGNKLTCLRWEDKTYFTQFSNQRKRNFNKESKKDTSL